MRHERGGVNGMDAGGVAGNRTAPGSVKVPTPSHPVGRHYPARCVLTLPKKKMLLTDVAVEHTLVSKTTGVRQTFVLHPFTDTQRESLGKFELVRDVQEPGRKDVRRSTYVSAAQLAELVAKGVLDECNCYVRMCPAQGKYPGANNPIKKLLPGSIRAGSPFEAAVRAVDASTPASRELRTALLRIGVKL